MTIRTLLVTFLIALVVAIPAALVVPVPATLANPFDDLMPEGDPTVPAVLATSHDDTGQAIVDFAMRYYGSPYVYAGNTPAGFDCSGFTQFVVLNVTGIDIGHGTAGQLAFGTPVAYTDLQPGDLVYFAGTWGPGISHTAIYIGDGQIIHAENETTGVTISTLWGGYDAWYYSAIRIA